jgi:DNA polymerase III alpha subunit
MKDYKGYTVCEDGTIIGKFGKKLKPRKIADVIAAMALFRPATMESGATDDFINRRQGSLALPERHQIISDETKETYGVLLYQEQVIGVMRSVGLDNEEIEKARKAIKASNASVGTAAKDLANLMGRIRKLGAEKGMNARDLDWLEEALHAVKTTELVETFLVPSVMVTVAT